MFTETGELCLLAYAKVTRDGITNSKKDRLTNEREKDDVIGNEEKIKPALTVSRIRRVVRW